MSAVGVSLLELALCGLLPNCDLASPVAHMERREGKEKVLLESWFLFFGGGFFFFLLVFCVSFFVVVLFCLLLGTGFLCVALPVLELTL